MKKLIEKFFYIFFSTKTNKIYKKIRKYDVVSFDIFDTLVKRNVKDPDDIFITVQKKYNSKNKNIITNLKNDRIKAYYQAKLNSDQEEVMLDDIYNNLDVKKNVKKQLMDIEIDTEIESTFVNNDLQDIFDSCLEDGKTVIITSDMYLSQDVIKKILEKTGYSDYNKLYLSSDIKLSKRTGNIFKMIKDEYKGKRIVHIGDHPLSDFIRPKQNKISSILIKK